MLHSKLLFRVLLLLPLCVVWCITPSVATAEKRIPIELVSPPTIGVPLLIPDIDSPLNDRELTFEAGVVYDLTSDSIVYQKNLHLSLPQASLTKLMTALVASETYDPLQVLTVPDISKVEGNAMDLIQGEQITVEDLLNGLLVFSGNDAAYTLASYHPEGYEGFIAAMNRKSRQLRLTRSSFANPAGLDDTYQYASARDMVLLTRAVLERPELADIISQQFVEVRSVDQRFVHPLYTTHQLIGRYPGVFGGKTGSTESAKECLVTVYDHQGHRYVVVILGSTQRYDDTRVLLNWVRESLSWTEVEWKQ